MRNERTSARVAKIAGRILALKDTAGERVHFRTNVLPLKYVSFPWSDIRALAASALTQTRDRNPRKGGGEVAKELIWSNRTRNQKITDIVTKNIKRSNKRKAKRKARHK